MKMKEPIRSYYAIIPANVRYDDELTPNAKLLYGEVTALCNEKGYCWASNSYFANLYGVSTKSISNWVNQLVNSGYLTSEMTYKEGSKEIQSRHLKISSNPMEEKVMTPRTKGNDPMEEKFHTYGRKGYDPMEEKVKDNTTTNNTYNNTINNTSKNTSRNSAKAKYADDSPYLKLSNLLFSKILERNPKHKKPSLQKWADDVRKTIELDKRDIEEYHQVLEWSQSHVFWQNNILSTDKIRKQYDKLYIQMTADKQNKQQPQRKPYSKQKRVVEVPDWMKQQQANQQPQQMLAPEELEGNAERLQRQISEMFGK